ncbi:MAG TPA: alginate lyase family protein [Planctomycetaceae bacterium]|nr:alginate lyase family protein [Planctomycetaceae bacterium]
MSASLLHLIRRGLQKPPHVVAARLLMEARRTVDRTLADLGAKRISRTQLLTATGAESVGRLWQHLAGLPYVASHRVDPAEYEALCPGDQQRILNAAEKALARRIDLFGSGDIELGPQIDWHRDYRCGHTWPASYALDLDYSNLDQPSDVKFPWELSRLQWLMPAGQAYALTGDERFAEGTRAVLEEWIDANPCMYGVNWACTMEVALRILSWTWFFHIFHDSAAWRDEQFRERFLCTLYAHARFTDHYLEYSDINGNHCVADAAGLVFAGLFFGNTRQARRWHRRGWQLLMTELPRQVFEDGVDFEASIPYHRLVLELFLLPALYREARGEATPATYRERLLAMSRFTQAYTRADSSIPLWGDNDDGRALPFGGQATNDHRYVPQQIAVAWDDQHADTLQAAHPEAVWLHGPDACRRFLRSSRPDARRASAAFTFGGFYVMQNATDHVFIDCGPVGLAGRGGHGHNDCLSFEAVLDGVHLVTDCGSYVYTASPEARMRFRSTGSHNTPQINSAELNRFISPRDLWHLHDDAQPELLLWSTGPERDVFQGSHSGYTRLAPAIVPVRQIVLHHRLHVLEIHDRFECSTPLAAPVSISIPLHLAEAVEPEVRSDGEVWLRSAARDFVLKWQGTTDWKLSIEDALVSPTYGVARPTRRLVWRADANQLPELCVQIRPSESGMPAGGRAEC